AFRCCQWLLDRAGNVGNDDQIMFGANQKAWQILSKHHSSRKELPTLCCRAVQYLGPAQEQFLRDLLMRQDLSREAAGFATVALGELLAHKGDYIENQEVEKASGPSDEFAKYVENRRAPEWGADLVPANLEKFKAEGIGLFRVALDKYAD